MYLFFLVANASHFLQPLDAEPFAAFHRFLRRTNEAYMLDAIMVGKSTRDALLAAAYHSKRRTFTPRVVTKSFKTTGLWPLNIPVVLARAHDNLGVAPSGETAFDEERVMASEIIAAARERSAKVSAGVSSGTVSVQRDALHSPYSLLAAAHKRTAEQEEEAAQRRARKMERIENKAAKVKNVQEAAAARLILTCRACAVSGHRGGAGWKVCLCGNWRACPKCKDEFSKFGLIATDMENCSAGFGGSSE